MPDILNVIYKGFSHLETYPVNPGTLTSEYVHGKRAHYYIGSLAFSLHYHSFAFLLLTVLLLLSKIPIMSLILLLAPILLAVYLFISLRTVYRQSRIVILLKTAIIGILHLLSLVLLFLLAVFTSLLIF